jgi:hypothetical protein
MIRLDKNQGTNIILDMLEQVGAVELLEEIVQSLSSDELSEIVDHIDAHLFERHYSGLLEDEPDVFD